MAQNNIDILGAGVLSVPPDPLGTGTPPCVGLDDKAGRRLTLHAVPSQAKGILVAVLQETADIDDAALVHAWAPGGIAITLGEGTVWANQPAPGHGPADLVGIAYGPGKDGLYPLALEALAGKQVRLEVHQPGCPCPQKAPIPAQRRSTESGVRR